MMKVTTAMSRNMTNSTLAMPTALAAMPPKLASNSDLTYYALKNGLIQ